MVSSSHMKPLSNTTQGSDVKDEVNKSEEFDGKDYIVGSLFHWSQWQLPDSLLCASGFTSFS